MYLCPQPKKTELGDNMLIFEVGSEPPVKTRLSSELSVKESYRITADGDGVTITGADEIGIYYGKLTLNQIMLNYRGCLPYMNIYDEPCYSYRGFMIDSCRHFFGVDEIKKIIDAAAYFKFNKFHFHLSDDQGFRVEIESYPLLTAVGSVRKSSDFDRNEKDDSPYGGFYTKNELKEIVEFCRERHIDVIPEFDIPGHTTAMIAAYPELSCTGKKIEPKTHGGIFKDILCAGNPDTLKAIYAVTDELCEIFDGEYFHIGGDEVPKNRWNNCTKCNAKLNELGLDNMQQLQGWLMNEVADYLKSKNKKAICWNDALRGGNLESDNTTVALWLDKTNRTVKWANDGNPVIAENFSPYYCDYPHGMHTLKQIYEFNPRKIGGLTEKGAASIIGIESPIWTEHIRDFEKLSSMCFPRWLAVAQSAWCGNDKPNYKTFLKNVCFYCDVLKSKGITSAPKSELNISPIGRAKQTLEFFYDNFSLKQYIKDIKND